MNELSIENINGEDFITIRLPLWQARYNPLLDDEENEKLGKIHNIMGIFDGREYGLAHLINLEYKSDIQWSDFIYQPQMSKKEFNKWCEDNRLTTGGTDSSILRN